MKILRFDQSRCNGCGACRMVCSLKNSEQIQPSLSRIRLQGEEEGGPLRAAYCQHCAEPVCVTACMRGIISKNPETGFVERKTEDCFRCAACAVMCPVGAVVQDERMGAFVTCDLCGEDPLCARLCPTKALRYEDVETTISDMRSRYAEMALAEEVEK